MLPADEEWHLDTQRLGRRVLHFAQLDSTSSLAASLASDPGLDGLAVLADEQTAGRGQYGRAWLAPPGASVLLSLLLFPPPTLSRPVLLTAWAAVSVCKLVARMGLSPHIKWPNDVLLEGRKVCGILIESRVQNDLTASVVGIGLNVRQSADQLAAAGLPEAVSLAQLISRPLETRTVAWDLLHQLDEDYDLLCRGELQAIELAWQGYLNLLGRPVIAVCSGAPQHGLLQELSFEGVILAGADGQLQVLQPEHIQSLRLEEGPPGVKRG